MKQFLLPVTFFLFAICSKANIIRVNNADLSADYTNILDAAYFANTGDTLHIEPSDIQYHGGLIDKKLTLIGNGYFLDKNENTQADKRSSDIQHLDLGVNASGAILTGLTIQDLNINANQVLVTRNWIKSIITSSSNLTDVFISANFIEQSISIDATTSNLKIFNNIVYEITLSGTSTSTIIDHNVINGGMNVKNSVIQNNILVYGAIPETNQTNIYYNNIVFSDQLELHENGSTGNIVATGLYDIIEPSSPEDPQDAIWQVIPGSAATSAATDGTDCGAFGGDTPYRLSGIPSIPSIYSITVPPNTTGTGMIITISVNPAE